MSQRRMLWSCSTEYTSTVLRCSLARYMAMSALCRSSATSSPCSGREGDAGAGGDGERQAVHLDRAVTSRCGAR